MMTRTDAVRMPSEMSADVRFRRRLRRLIVVSAVMLGAITLLAALSTDARPVTIGLLAAGWLLMPTLLHAGLDRPRLRYLLIVPATLVSVGSIVVASGVEPGSTAAIGWWLIAGGVLFGGGLGSWFWYRWMPVPDQLDDPFSPGRIALIAVHVALVVIGMALVIAA
jgi:hypothetical protein